MSDESIPAEVLERAERLGPADLRKPSLLERLREQVERAQDRYDQALNRVAGSPDSHSLTDKYLNDLDQADEQVQRLRRLVSWQEHVAKQKAIAS